MASFEGAVLWGERCGRVYLVPDHYGRSLKYVHETLAWAKENGIKVPNKSFIRLEVLKGRQLCIEFKAPRPTYNKTIVFVDPPTLLMHG